MDYFNSAIKQAANPFTSGENALAEHGYHALKTSNSPNSGFIQISPNAGFQENGWKFHISTSPEDHERAWNIVAKNAMENGLVAKFAIGNTLNNMSQSDNDRKGRAITIYASDDTDMQKVVAKINSELETAGIKPGHSPNGDRKLGGSPYMSYRNDYDANGKYLDSVDLKHLPEEVRYNPTGKPDPFKTLDVSVKKPAVAAQPTKPALSDDLRQVAEYHNRDDRKVYNGLIPAPSTADSQALFGKLAQQAEISGSGPNRIAHIPVADYSAHELRQTLLVLEQAQVHSQFVQHQGPDGKPQLMLQIADSSNTHRMQRGWASPIDVIEQRKMPAPLAQNPSPYSNAAPYTQHKIDWAKVEPFHTDKGTYISVEGMNAAQIAAHKESLAQAGIPTQEKRSSLNGGMNVLAVSPRDMAAFDQFHANAIKPAPIDFSKLETVPTSKGTYIPTDSMTPQQIEAHKEALQRAGITVTEKVSSLNGGTNVLAIPPQDAAKLEALKNTTTQMPHQSDIKPSAPAANNAIPADTQAPADKPVTGRAREQLATTAPTPTPAPSQPSAAPPKPSTNVDTGETPLASAAKSGLGSKVDAKLGKAGMAAEAGVHLAQGDVAGAAKSVAEGVATQAAVKAGVGFVAKRIPGIGAVVTLGMSLFSAGAEAAQGNWKKAGGELLAGSAEAAGNIVGFGAGDAAREAVRAGLKAAGGPEVEKSGVRQLAEKSYDIAKIATDKARYGSMKPNELASAIQGDNTLHKTVNQKGQTVPLAEALKDKDFRGQYLKTLEEQTASGKFDRSSQIAMIKAYGEKLDASSPAKPAAPSVAQSTPTTQTAALNASNQAQQMAQYKGMSISQVASAIQKDDVLPDKVKLGGKDVDLAEALKDKSFRQTMLTNLESAQAKGSDLSTQIAMIKSYGEKLDTDTKKPPAPAMAAAKPSMAASPVA